MTEDVRGAELDRLRSELAKQRANNERMTATLREARAQILTLKAEVDRLAEPPSAYGVYLDTLDDGSINIFTGGRKMRVVATPAVDVSQLVPGQEVMLNEAMNIVEIAGFEQRGDIVMLKEILEGGGTIHYRGASNSFDTWAGFEPGSGAYDVWAFDEQGQPVTGDADEQIKIAS